VPPLLDLFGRLALALGLGLLIGLQRERTDARLAGFRTFPLVTLFGALCGLLGGEFGGWVVGGGALALALVIVGGNLGRLRDGGEPGGVTSEVTVLVMFALGVYLMHGELGVGIAVCGAVAVLLHLKPQLHSLAARIGDRDFKAVMQFALISLVVLPVLPDRTYGPYDVLNPFRIWLMVVLIVGISLAGYVAYKLLGARAGAWAAGVLGGLISSTATTVSVARRSGGQGGAPALAAFVILVASAIVFLRVGLLVGATAPAFLRDAAVPLGAMFLVLLAAGAWHLRAAESGAGALPEQENPTELKSALLFGLLYAIVQLAVAAANTAFGDRGLYVAAVLSGLTDMDAITLSIAQLVGSGQADPATGWRLILVASLSNLAFKSVIVASSGGSALFRRVALGFGAAGLVGGGLLAFG